MSAVAYRHKQSRSALEKHSISQDRSASDGCLRQVGADWLTPNGLWQEVRLHVLL